jgi:hypothetical protein
VYKNLPYRLSNNSKYDHTYSIVKATRKDRTLSDVVPSRGGEVVYWKIRAVARGDSREGHKGATSPLILPKFHRSYYFLANHHINNIKYLLIAPSI